MMSLFNRSQPIDFMGMRFQALCFSALLFLLSALGLAYRGLHLGIDFTGGQLIEVRQAQASIELDQVRTKLARAGYESASVQAVGQANRAVIKLGVREHRMTGEQVRQLVGHLFPQFHIERVDLVGPQVGQRLLNQGVLALVVSLLATMFYIALRFEYRFACSAALALIHDPVLILGVFAWFQVEFNLITLAALLTILGYSLNDTIVVYDRVRENMRQLKGDMATIMNTSITQTLSRTIMTSGLTFLVVLSLFLLGGTVLQGFALALLIGIVIGTYSSIYIAGSVAVMLGLKQST